MKLRWFSSSDLLATALTVAIVLGTSLGAPLKQEIVDKPSGEHGSRAWARVHGANVSRRDEMDS